MALGDGGLDAQVEQRMDAYRGDPQKLQQRYGQNKELLDLLALQKLTSEKKQVAADMQLKAENNPNTIAQQREAEALQLTKSAMGGTLSELAGRTKGTLDQKNTLQRQNMGKLAQRAAQPNAGGIGSLGRQAPRSPVNPQAGGLGNARMMQAQKQAAPVRMAGGGIVAFAAGEGVSGQGGLGGITQEQIDAYRKTEMRGRRAAMTDAQIRAVLMERAGIETPPNKVEKINQPMNFSGVNTGESVGGITNISKPTNQLPQDTGVPLSEAVLPPAVDNSTTQRPDDGSGIASLTNPFTKAADPAPVDNSFLGTENETNVNAAMQTGFSQGDAQMRRDEANQAYEGMKAQLAAFDQENYGQNEDLSNFLIGMGGTGSAGAAMRGGKSAMDAGVKNRRNRLMDNLSLEIKRLGNDAVLGAKGIELAKTLAANAQSNANNMRSNVTEMTKAGMTRATQAARLLFDKEKAVIDNTNKNLDRQVNILQDDTNRLNIRMSAAYKVSNDIANLRSTLQTSLKENPPYSDSLLTAGMALEEALEGGKNREIAAAKATIAAIQGEINVAAEKTLNNSKLLDLEENANSLIRNQVRKSDSSTNFSGATIGGYKE